MELNETKLTNVLKASELRPATEEEIEAIGAVPGYASPIGIPAKNNYLPVVIVVDDLIPESTNLVAGSNETGYHCMNTNYGRDYKADIIADITAAQEGDGCPSAAWLCARRAAWRSAISSSWDTLLRCDGGYFPR